MPFVLELDNFQGPFDLLLKLLDQQKLEITEISLTKITDDYINYIGNMDLSIEEMNSFLYIAAKLSLDKSRAIISTTDIVEDEIDLTASLREYKIIKQKAEILSKLSSSPMKSRFENIYKLNNIANVYPDDLGNIYLKVVSSSKESQKIHKINNSKSEIDLAKLKFKNQLLKLKSFSLDEMMSKPSNRSEAIVFFLSILELLKSQKLKAERGTIIEVMV